MRTFTLISGDEYKFAIIERANRCSEFIISLRKGLSLKDKFIVPTFIVCTNLRPTEILNLNFHPLASSIYISKPNSLKRDYIRFVPIIYTVFTLEIVLSRWEIQYSIK